MTHMSTTANEDFSGVDGEHFILERVDPGYMDEGASFLEYPNRWFVSCRFGGCSCHFRNSLALNPPEFRPPEDWSPEDPEDVEATGAFYDFVASLLAKGHSVDSVTVWTPDAPFDSIWTREVSLSAVSREVFQFLDGYRFRYAK